MNAITKLQFIFFNMHVNFCDCAMLANKQYGIFFHAEDSELVSYTNS